MNKPAGKKHFLSLSDHEVKSKKGDQKVNIWPEKREKRANPSAIENELVQLRVSTFAIAATRPFERRVA